MKPLALALVAGCITASDGTDRPYCYEMQGAGDVVIRPCPTRSPPLPEYPERYKHESTVASAPGPNCTAVAWTCLGETTVEVSDGG